jgi:hypothetical protein
MTETVDSPQKQGLPTLAWVAIGCGVIVVIMVLVLTVGGLFMAKKIKDVAGDLDFEDDPAMSAARLIVRMNPELEEVAVDAEAGTITVRHTDTGETVTVDIDDLRDGKISFTTEEGAVTIEASGDPEEGTLKVSSGDETWTLKTGVETSPEVPDWVPVFPDTETESTHSMTSDGRMSGGFQLQSDEDVDALFEFYRSRLDAMGFKVRADRFSSEGDNGGVVHGQQEDSGRSVTAMIRSNEDGSTRVAVSYQEEQTEN